MDRWRFLIDEDTATEAVSALRERGFDAVSVIDAVGEGATDPAVWEYARDSHRILVTTDRDFLDRRQYEVIRVIMVADTAAKGNDIADRIEKLVEFANQPTDLRQVTWI